MPTTRKADPADAATLAAFAEATFRATFGADNSAEDMELHCRTSYGVARQAAEIADPAWCTLLSEHEGRLVGFAQLRFGAAPAGVDAARPGELHRLYVDAAWHGRGVAGALMAACHDELERRAADAVWLGVWERNPRAIAFYRRSGFVEVGEHVFQLGSDPQRDVIMAKTLEPAVGADLTAPG